MPDEIAPDPAIPFPPMEAELVRELPEGDGWQYEPKWDGFRGVLENVGGELALWSRKERPLLRYFPELRPLGELLPPRSALDGEIVIVRDGALDFDAMQMRLHPAESRIRRLVGRDPGRVRRRSTCCSGTASRCGSGRSRSGAPSSSAWRAASGSRRARGDLAEARGWLDRFEALGLDGVVAKRPALPYLPGLARRHGQGEGAQDAPTASSSAFAGRASQEQIATLLLGLYRDDGGLDYVGSCAVAASRRAEVAQRVLPLLEAATGRSASPSRTAGAPASSRRRPCARSSWSRCATTRCRATASATARSGSAGARTRDPRDCTWRELRPPRDPNAAGVESLLR